MIATALTPIRYDHATDLIEPTGARREDHVVRFINGWGFEVVSRQAMGWGDHNAIIYTDEVDYAGYYLATLAD